ncbi:transcriptional regulator ATRX [Cheilinus undulatus]|uniref:transcriptional regulator ATRX n=1 Tax=Cheilinus undulatus TaxID=241271 RepID=UPI001BD5B60C|nr:transcriptional regulator ATRX [Cheilinus undulatus]
MRPTTATMLQQNNNNNYPCLNVSGSTREMLQKCSRASLPFPGRMELGLGDLPLIRGLRAWALCSKNRRKAGGLLGGGQAPMAPPASRLGSTPCPRPADVYLSGEWGRLGYGLPLGLDGGALVTVATLKTSEGGGKTQTQCLFLRTEKGSCLYSTAKPGSGLTSSTASSVGGWLRGKAGGGSRDNGPTPPTQTGANRVRVRSGRRWRKSCNAAGRDKAGASRELQQSNRGDPAGEIVLEEKQEEGDKGGLDSKQEDRSTCRSSRCCHNDSPKTCNQCGRRVQRRESQEGSESPRGGVRNNLNSEAKGMKKERPKPEEEGGVCDSVLAVPNPDLQSNHSKPESLSGCDVEEIREAESNEKTSHIKDKCSEKREDTDSEEMKVQAGNNGFSRGRPGRVTDDISSRERRDIDHGKPGEIPCEEIAADVNGFLDCVETHHKSEAEIVGAGKEEINPALGEFSSCPEDVSSCTEPSASVEGSTCNTSQKNFVVWSKKESSNEAQIEEDQQGVADPGFEGKEEVNVRRIEQKEAICANTVNEDRKPQFSFKNVVSSSKKEEIESFSSSLSHKRSSIFETDKWIAANNIQNDNKSELDGERLGDEMVLEEKEEKSQEDERGNLEGKEVWTTDDDSVYGFSVKESKGKDNEDSLKGSSKEVDYDEEEVRNCESKHILRLQVSTDGCRENETEAADTCAQTSVTHVESNGETNTNVTNVPCTDPSTSITLSLANPAPSLPPLGSMATGLPCLEAEKEEEEEGGLGVTVVDREGDQEGKRRHGRELEEQVEEERGSTVATDEGRTEEEEQEEEDEFGVFMQAEGELAWSEGSSMSASVPCGSRGSVVPGNLPISGESTHWTPGWTDGSFHQSDDTWTAFPQDSSDEGRDAAGQWWPTSAVEQSREKLLGSQNLASVFAKAFPSLPASSSSDLDTVPTLTQILRGRADQDQGLLDSFHDLNKMICQRYKRANGVSRDLLLKTLHLEQPLAEGRPAPRTANRRLSPGLPSANQHAQNAAAKRRLSYDYNRNIME